MQGTPEEAYRAFWLAWSGAAVVAVAVVFIAARLWLVNPIVRAQRESADRIVQAVVERD